MEYRLSRVGFLATHTTPGAQPTQPASRPLTKSERDESSTAREMLGIEFSIITNVTQFSGHSVIFLVGNQGCPSIARKGSPVPRLQSIAIRLSDLTIAHNIALHMVWVPRSLNALADAESREFEDELHDWTLSSSMFSRLCSLVGWHPTIDLFATADNSKCNRFFSRRHMAGSSGVNSCFYPLPKGERLYACPPLGKSLPKFVSRLPAPSPVLLVIPHWPSRHWFSTLPTRRAQFLCSIPVTAFDLGPNGRPYFLTSRQFNMHFDAFIVSAST